MSEDLEMQIDFNPELAEAAAEEQTYNEGWVRSRITRVKKDRSKPDESQPDGGARWFMIVPTLTPMENPEDPGSAVGRGIMKWIMLPVEPPHWEESVQSGLIDEAELDRRRELLVMFTRQWHEFAHACFPEEVPDVPRKVDGVWYFNGEEISEDDLSRCKEEARKAAGEVMKTLWNEDVQQLVDAIVYHQIAFKEGEDRPEVRYFSAEHPIRNGQQVELVPEPMNKPKLGKPKAEKAPTKAAAKKTTAKKTAAKGKSRK